MQIRRARPNPIQRLIRISIGLAEMRKPVLAFRVQIRLIRRKRYRCTNSAGKDRYSPKQWFHCSRLVATESCDIPRIADRKSPYLACFSPDRSRTDIAEAAESRSNRECAARLAWSTVTGVTPAPSDALRFRSSTEVLFPSQCRCIPSRGCWFHSDGKSDAPINSSCGSCSRCPVELQRFVRIEGIHPAPAPGRQRSAERVAHAILQFERLPSSAAESTRRAAAVSASG